MDFDKPFYLNNVIVDPINNTLTFPEKQVNAPHKLIKLLQYFANNPNRTISNEELSEQVWDGFVSENTRYTQIANLRKLLNDNPNSPRFLKTVPREGYIFIATVKSIDNKKDNTRYKPFIYLLSAVLILTFGMSLYLFSESFTSNQNAIKLNYDYRPLLSHHKQTIIINSHIPNEITRNEKNLLSLAGALTNYYLSQNTNYHIVFAPLEYTDFKKDIFIHHFQNSNPVLFGISFNFYDTHDKLHTRFYNDKLEIHERPITLIKSKSLNEQAEHLDLAIRNIIEEELGFTIPVKPQVNTITKASNISDVIPLFNGIQADYNAGTKKIEQLADLANQTNSALLISALFSTYINFSFNWGRTFNIEKQFNLVHPLAIQQLNSQPRHLNANLVIALTHCLNSSHDCAQELVSLWGATQDLTGTSYFLPYVYNSHSFAPLDLSQHAYELFPLFNKNNNYYRYFFSLLENKKFSQMDRLIQNANFWSDRDWSGKRTYGKTSKKNIMEFQAWYNKRMHAVLGDRSVDLLEDHYTSASYITNNLLNANRPDIAFKWQKFTKDKWIQLEIFFLASLWQDSWDQHKWLILSGIAEKKFSDISVYDKWRLAYFEEFAGLPENALLYYQDLFPELFETKIMITLDNVRAAVYLNQVLKQLGHQSQSQSLEKALANYFDHKNITPEIRTGYFGLTDIQYYALKGDAEQALTRLERAIKQEDWLPNAYWIWPPISNDPYLSPLKKLKEFKELAKYQKAYLASICLGDNC